MAERRQFRFRLPRLTAIRARRRPPPAPEPPAPAPAPEPQPPAPPPPPEPQPQPTTTTDPILRPPFQPAEIAPVQPLSPLPQPRTPPGPPTNGRPQVSSLPASPSREAAPQEKAASLPPSPTRTASQPQPEAQKAPEFQSPSHFAPRRAGLTSSQPSPSRTPMQVQPTASQQPALPQTTQPPPSAFQQEESKPVVSLLEPQSIQSKTETTPETAPKLQNQTETLTATAAVTPALDAPPATKLSDSQAIGAEPVKELKETEEEMKIAEARTSGLANQEPMITSGVSSGSGRKARELTSTSFQAEQKRLEKEEVFKRKKMITTSFNGEHVKILNLTHPKPKNASSESHLQKLMVSNVEQVPLHKQITDDISRFVHKLGTGDQKQSINEKPVSIITLAGENRGASMNVGSEQERKSGSVHIHRGYKTNPDDSTEATTDGEESSRGWRPKNQSTKEEQEKKAYVNSNTQSINNSILFESSVNERNPGVQLTLSQNPQPDKPERNETRKTELSISHAEKLSYKPTVRRRCLRGLFAEPSDSDPNNPEKPRRHGCRYKCGDR